MYGVTKEGHSVTCYIHGFLPYFYCSTPPNFNPADCHKYRTALNRHLQVSVARDGPLHARRQVAGSREGTEGGGEGKGGGVHLHMELAG